MANAMSLARQDWRDFLVKQEGRSWQADRHVRSTPAVRRRRSGGTLWGFIRHARLSKDQASHFWDRMTALVEEFDRPPRSGETMYGFAVGIYPTHYPFLPPAERVE